MRPAQHEPYRPPATSNWTGRAPRSSQEAFGYQWGPPTEPTNRTPWCLWLIAIAVIALALAAAFIPR